MRRTILLIALAVTMVSGNMGQPAIIFDTDIGGDADDLGALAMLHHFIDRQECDLLAVMCWQTEIYAVSAIDAVNRHYRHPDIPIGARKDSLHHNEWGYNRPIAEKFHHELTHEDVPDAVVLYRQILAGNPDNSITIVTVGPLKNIEDLLKSGADANSPLSGKQLIGRKVKEFVIMGGRYPSGEKEWNFDGGMPGVTKFVIPNLPVPITFTGFEVGLEIKTGEVFNRIDPDTPLYAGFMHFSENAPWMKDQYQGRILDNASFDQTAVLYAVRNGVGKYWDKVTGGTCVPDETGGNTWEKDESSSHAYLKLTMDPEKLARTIESIMLGDF
jgi:inosine-uridine nucleoside N-ribohydrolase